MDVKHHVYLVTSLTTIARRQWADPVAADNWGRGGGWRVEMEDRGWRMEDGGWRVEMEDGGWRVEMEGGGWRVEGGGWKIEGGRWRVGGWGCDRVGGWGGWVYLCAWWQQSVSKAITC